MHNNLSQKRHHTVYQHDLFVWLWNTIHPVGDRHAHLWHVCKFKNIPNQTLQLQHPSPIPVLVVLIGTVPELANFFFVILVNTGAGPLQMLL